MPSQNFRRVSRVGAAGEASAPAAQLADGVRAIGKNLSVVPHQRGHAGVVVRMRDAEGGGGGGQRQGEAEKDADDLHGTLRGLPRRRAARFASPRRWRERATRRPSAGMKGFTEAMTLVVTARFDRLPWARLPHVALAKIEAGDGSKDADSGRNEDMQDFPQILELGIFHAPQ